MVAAVAAAAAIACRPAQGLGSLAYTRGGIRHVVDLGTCRDTIAGRASAPRPVPLMSPDGRWKARIAIIAGKQAIVVSSPGSPPLAVLTQPAWSPSAKNGSPGPLMLLGWSPDDRWVLFANDPMGSQSIIADGILVRAVPIRGGALHTVASMLGNDDYRAWCGSRLVLSAGGDRIATTNKRLLVTGPPSWHARLLAADPARAWGSLTCAPDGQAVVVQSQRAGTTNESFVNTRWSLWHVGFDGTSRRLTSPPPGYADESPRFSGTTLFFVRSHRGVGRVYALRGGKLLGPFASLGANIGYYGHHAWAYAVRR
jgi:hypothetical protein